MQKCSHYVIIDKCCEICYNIAVMLDAQPEIPKHISEHLEDAVGSLGLPEQPVLPGERDRLDIEQHFVALEREEAELLKRQITGDMTLGDRDRLRAIREEKWANDRQLLSVETDE